MCQTQIKLFIETAFQTACSRCSNAAVKGVSLFCGWTEWIRWSTFTAARVHDVGNIHLVQQDISEGLFLMENHRREKSGTVQQVCLHVYWSFVSTRYIEIYWTCLWCEFLSLQMDGDRDCLLSSHEDMGKSGTSSISSASFNFINSIIGSGIIGNVLLSMLLKNSIILNWVNTYRQYRSKVWTHWTKYMFLLNLKHVENANCMLKYCYKIIIIILNWLVEVDVEGKASSSVHVNSFNTVSVSHKVGWENVQWYFII